MQFFPHPKRLICKKLAAVTALFLLAFFAGGVLAHIRTSDRPATSKAQTTQNHPTSSGTSVPAVFPADINASASARPDSPVTASADLTSGPAASIPASCDNWGLSFQQEGKPPVANATTDYLKQFQAHYIGNNTDPSSPVLYLTFDAGYENGNTPAILDALKKHHAPAAFFLVGNYLETAPDLVQRMAAEGHTVGNHTWHHPDMSKIADQASFQQELSMLEQKFKEVTGQDMKKYYRPPQGKYSEENLKMAKDMGYHTFFWSLAYVDWYENKQPTHEEAFKKLLGRIHPGAIVLLHSTSKTNGEILDELLTKWEEMGYRFGTLDEVVNEQ